MTELQPSLFDGLPLAVSVRRALLAVRVNMLSRCYNPRNAGFCRYGQRGIAVCDEWRASPAAFLFWAVKVGYRRGLFIDREDNDGPYSPGNCRFVTRRVNQNNRRNTPRLSDGTPLADAARASGLSIGTVQSRVRRGISPDKAVKLPLSAVQPSRLPDGRVLVDAARNAGISSKVVRSRLRLGWSLEDALSIPKGGKRPSALPTLRALAQAAGVSECRVRSRLRGGWSLEDALSIPKGGKRPSARPTLVALARAAGLSRGTVRGRLRSGWSLDDALSVPKGGKRPSATVRVALGESEASAQGDKAQRPAALPLAGAAKPKGRKP